MKKITLVLILAAAGLVTSNAMAQESPWLVRARVVNISPDNGSDPILGSGAADRISVSEKAIPEVDVSYFFTKNWATELILTYPQKHDVFLDGNAIGSFKELPPTLTVQYHFSPDEQISPYLGLGLNYTRISNVSLLGGALSLDNHSFGAAAQAGVDYKLTKNWSLNLDVKYAKITSGVYEGATQISNVQVSPWLVGAGVGYRF